MRFRQLLFFFLLSLAFPFSLFSQPKDLDIVIPEGPKPWSSLEINHSEDQFQFAIVTDRTGGRRPGIFFKGVKKINLLQPEFVMTVGDLIDGYTKDIPELNRQWDEFDGFIDSLQMPFFYTPGNHDITNAVMDSIYRARFGPTFYHFVYKDVLFLSLNSEDQFRGAGRGTISDEQYEFIKKVLAENQDVRWTMVFMHQPLWLQNDPKRWPDVEKLLADREHTVFVGHVHHYVRYLRNNSRYYTLATTGGGSSLRGPALGEFDHITWVTMTDEGPIMANLALDGIYAEDLVTESDYEFITRLSSSYPIRISPLIVDGDTFEKGIIRTEIRNPEDKPVFVRLKPSFNFEYGFDLPRDTITVNPNSVEVIEWTLESRRGKRQLDELTVQPLAVDLTYEQEGLKMTLPFAYLLAPEERRTIPVTGKAPIVDGELGDWQELPFKFGAEDEEGLQVEWGIQQDNDHIYLAAKVNDNAIRVQKGQSTFQQDYIAIVVNAEPLVTSAMRKGEGGYRNSYTLAVSPETKTVDMTTQYQDRYDFKVPIQCRTTEEGYVLEMALPINYIQEIQGDSWRHLRINLSVVDWQGSSDEKATYYWQPNWRSSQNRLGSGLFFKE